MSARIAGIMLWLLATLAASAQAQTVEYLHTDALGSVVAVTNASRTVLERREYEPFGRQLTPAVTNGPGYTGHVQDAATGLVYMQQRYYDAQIGRFLSADPVAATIDDFNRYAYVRNNPLNGTDPTGEAVWFALPWIGVAIEKALVVTSAIMAGIGVAAVINEAKDGDGGAQNDNGDTQPAVDSPSDSASESTLKPGPHAGESIPARGPGRDFTPGERGEINEIGKETGCHTCGTKDPGTKSGNFVPDHQPPSAANPSGEAQRLYPQCLTCSRTQGGEVRQLKPPPLPDPIKNPK